MHAGNDEEVVSLPWITGGCIFGVLRRRYGFNLFVGQAMTIHVELDAEMETQLAAEAQVRGMALEQYAQRLLQEAIASRVQGRSRASQEEFRAFLDALASKAPDVPQLRTERFSRETIYGEHD
jgi:hypothetical protein